MKNYYALICAFLLTTGVAAQNHRTLFDDGLTPDRTVTAADGQSLTFVTVEVLDKQGTPVPEAAIPCEATVKGAGKLLAFASADLKDTEPYTSPRVKTWKGRALLVIRSTQKGGSVNVTIKSSLPTASLKLKSK